MLVSFSSLFVPICRGHMERAFQSVIVEGVRWVGGWMWGAGVGCGKEVIEEPREVKFDQTKSAQNATYNKPTSKAKRLMNTVFKRREKNTHQNKGKGA
jgi:hypothetical protein